MHLHPDLMIRIAYDVHRSRIATAEKYRLARRDRNRPVQIAGVRYLRSPDSR